MLNSKNRFGLGQSTLIICSLLTLISCSGSSLDSDTDTPSPTVLVNVGADQSVNEGTTFNLSGDATGQTTDLTYQWSSAPALTITHPDTSAAAATFDAPVTTETLSYTLTLLVTDGNGNRGSDSMVITVQPVNEPPVAVISVTKPTGIANNVFPAGIEIVLDSANSSDVDAAAGSAAIVDWQWQQTAGTSVLGSVSLNGDNVAFLSPIEDADSTLSFELTVTDQEGATGTTTLDIQVLSASNTVPSVNAGVEHTVFSGEIISLNGEADSTIPAALPLQFSWLNDSDLVPLIDDNSSLKTFAIAPLVSIEQNVTFTLEVKDNFGNEVDDSITVKVKPLPLSVLNDTGVTQQASDTSVGTAFQPDYPGQDGQRGPDRIHTSGMLEKAGRGDNGFDFTRLDSLGDEVDDVNQPWNCVRDNVTGLVWEVKTSDHRLNSSLYSFSWYQTTNNGGVEGNENGAGTACTMAACNTTSYVNQVNTVGRCNFNDWRVPTKAELRSIVHFGRSQSPFIDTEYFPNTNRGISDPLYYWTIQPSADGTDGDDARNAWAIDFSTGNDNFLNKDTPARIRLVRGGR